MGRKAQGMSLTLVIAAVIGIVVLVVLLVIFGGKTKLFSKAAASCESKGAGATCVATSQIIECQEIGMAHTFGTDCGQRDEDLPVCCVPVSGSISPKKPAPPPPPEEPKGE